MVIITRCIGTVATGKLLRVYNHDTPLTSDANTEQAKYRQATPPDPEAQIHWQSNASILAASTETIMVMELPDFYPIEVVRTEPILLEENRGILLTTFFDNANISSFFEWYEVPLV
jgi:hypothetical protein